MGKLYRATLLILAFLNLAFSETSSIEWVDVTANTIIYGVDSKLEGFIDIYSLSIHGAKYDSISDSECIDPYSPILVCENGCWGYADRKTGEYLVPNRYEARVDSEFTNGYGILGSISVDYDIADKTDIDAYLFDNYGRMISFPFMSEPDSQVDHNRRVKIRNRESGLYGIAQIDGLEATVVIPMLYDNLSFYDDVACSFTDNGSEYKDSCETYSESLSVISISSGEVYLCTNFSCVDDEVYYTISTPCETIILGLYGHDIIFYEKE